MHADKPFRHAELAQRAARARAKYSADHFELEAGAGYGLEPADAANIDRDPRMDPQPGDELTDGHVVREVRGRIGSRIEYGRPGRPSEWAPLLLWQAWARRADVQKVAP